MFNFTLKDNETAIVHAGPRTTPSASFPDGRPASCQNLTVNSTDAFLTCIVVPGPNPSTDPTFRVTPQSRFFGADRVILVHLIGLIPGSGGATKSVDMTVTVQGSEPDNGLMDHFSPSNETPTPQS